MARVIKASFSLHNTEALLKEFRQVSGKTGQEALEQGARIAAVSLARSTQPYGDDAAAKTKGEAAVERDVKRSVARIGDAFVAIKRVDEKQAGMFWKAVRARKWPRAQEILDRSGCSMSGLQIVDEVDQQKRHSARSRHTGRVRGGPTQIVRSTNAQKRAVKSEQRNVGKGKGGWAGCARILGGTRGIPHFVTRHAEGRGAVVRNYAANRSSIRLMNRVKYSHEILRPSERDRALRIATDRMRTYMQISIEKIKAKQR